MSDVWLAEHTPMMQDLFALPAAHLPKRKLLKKNNISARRCVAHLTEEECLSP
jgi:hypothetical protein